MSSSLVAAQCAESSREIMSPNWMLGLLRVCAILTSLWVATMTGVLAQYVSLVLRGQPHSIFRGMSVSGSVIIALVPPVVLFALAFAGVWIGRRFHRPSSICSSFSTALLRRSWSRYGVASAP